MAMTDARDRAIEALCDTIADLRKRVEYLEIAIRTVQPPTAPLEATFPPGTQLFSDKLPMTMAEARGAAAGAVTADPNAPWSKNPPGWVGGQATPQPGTAYNDACLAKAVGACTYPDCTCDRVTADELRPEPGKAYEVAPVYDSGYVPGIGWPKA